MSEVEIGVGPGARITPRACVDRDGAHESAEMELSSSGHRYLWSPSIVARCHEAALIALRAGRFAMAPVRIGILAGHKHAHRPAATCSIAPAGAQIAENDDVARHSAQKILTHGRRSTSQLPAPRGRDSTRFVWGKVGEL